MEFPICPLLRLMMMRVRFFDVYFPFGGYSFYSSVIALGVGGGFEILRFYFFTRRFCI